MGNYFILHILFIIIVLDQRRKSKLHLIFRGRSLDTHIQLDFQQSDIICDNVMGLNVDINFKQE